jgi:P4 family phage/plasmid primase-like protien
MKLMRKFFKKFACVPTKNKIPIIEKWPQLIKTDLDTILTTGQYGLLTGKTNNITVIDIDPFDPKKDKKHIKDGLKVYKKLLKKYNKGKPLETATVKTRRGYHIYFIYDKEINGTSKINSSTIDTRNNANQVICPNSEGYKWLKDIRDYPPIPIPSWLKSWLQKDPKAICNKYRKKNKKKKKKKKKEKIVDNNYDLELNNLFNTKCQWTLSETDEGHKLDHDSMRCLITKKKHSTPNHSCVYINKTNSIMSCFGCEDKKLSLSITKQLKTILNIKTIKTIKKVPKREICDLLNKNDIDKTKEEKLIEKILTRMTEYQVAKLIKLEKCSYVCSDITTDTVYYFNDNTWALDKGNIILIKHIRKLFKSKSKEYYKNIVLETDKAVFNGAREKFLSKHFETNKFMSAVVSSVCSLIYDSKFLSKLDSKVDLLGFDDGVYDLKKKKFRKARKSDYVTLSVGYNFPKKSHKYEASITDFFTKVFPNEDVRNYTLRQIAQSLSGRLGEHKIHTHTGFGGGNGKSILCKLIDDTFGDYSQMFATGMITQKKPAYTGADPFTLLLKGVRYAYCAEPRSTAVLNSSTVKSITGGESMQARTLYSSNIEKFYPQLHLNIFCNKKMIIDGDDGGIRRRMTVVTYISTFEDKIDPKNHIYKIDYDLNKKVRKWRKDFILYLLSLYDINYRWSCPQIIEEESKMYLDSNNDIKLFVEENLTKTDKKEDFIQIKELKQLYKSNREYEQCKLKDFKNLLEKELKTVCTKQYGPKRIRNVFVGWKIVEEQYFN